mmetsp:Transcript_1821/g.3967  ORF Transcript_1821/g.3967 Transcript_1821/m.3967 type:complete len:121 (+) Transcript_1821:554-916(+)
MPGVPLEVQGVACGMAMMEEQRKRQRRRGERGAEGGSLHGGRPSLPRFGSVGSAWLGAQGGGEIRRESRLGAQEKEDVVDPKRTNGEEEGGRGAGRCRSENFRTSQERKCRRVSRKGVAI